MDPLKHTVAIDDLVMMKETEIIQRYGQETFQWKLTNCAFSPNYPENGCGTLLMDYEMDPSAETAFLTWVQSIFGNKWRMIKEHYYIVD